MMSRLLAWNDALFVVGCEQGKLQLQRVDIDIASKEIAFLQCPVTCNNEATGLPLDARLVAANEVEDSVLAMYVYCLSFLSKAAARTHVSHKFVLVMVSSSRYPVLVFLASHEAQPSVSIHGQRQQSIENADANVSITTTTARVSTSWLFLCLLYAKDGRDEMELRLVNTLEIPTSFRDEDVSGIGKTGNMLQVFVMDGPHVLLFEPRLHHMTVLKLQKAMQSDVSLGCPEALGVVYDMKDDALEPNSEVVSCTYMSKLHSTRPHILIHMLRRSSSSSSDRYFYHQ